MPKPTRIERFEVNDPHHGPLPALALLPPEPSPPELPVCAFLYGGGGNQEALLALEPLVGAAWRDGSLAPMLVACLGVPPFCFYLDDPARGSHFQSAVSRTLFGAVCERFGPQETNTPAGLVGISMGGYGALKIAFDAPSRFAAVAAIAPMIEPHTDADAVPLRNRWYYPPLVPPALLGPERDRALFASDHPATRARQNAAEILAADLAIQLDAGSRDALSVQDGVEFLHRVLWELDIPHDYHLLRDADHVGPTIAPRLLSAFRWVGQQLTSPRPAASSAEELSLREHLEPVRRRASAIDPTLGRTYGVLRQERTSRRKRPFQRASAVRLDASRRSR
jgi:S-formylglutathione hydrolase